MNRINRKELERDANNDIHPGKRQIRHKSDMIAALQKRDDEGERMNGGQAERLAKRILANTLPFDVGTCEKCGGAKNDRLVPVTLKICRQCCQKIKANVDYVRVDAVPAATYRCDLCFGRALTMYRINPRICPTCLDKLGRIYRRAWPGKNQAARGH